MHILWRMHWLERHQTEEIFLALYRIECERGLTPLICCKRHFYKPTRPKVIETQRGFLRMQKVLQLQKPVTLQEGCGNFFDCLANRLTTGVFCSYLLL